MTPEVQNALELLKGLLANPVVYNTLFLIAVGLIPKSVLDKLPIVGTLITLLKTMLEAQTAKQEAKKVNAGAVIAKASVEGYEQLKKTGKVDGATAAAETTRIVADKTGVNPELARILTEQAVRQTKKDAILTEIAQKSSITPVNVSIPALPQKKVQ